MKKPLRIGINAQIPAAGGAGGIETVLKVLTALGSLDGGGGGGEEYVFIAHPSAPDWLQPFLSGRQKIVRAPQENKSARAEKFKRLLGALRPLARGVKRFFTPPPETKSGVAVSDGFYESLNCDLIHFPYQDYVYCKVPTVYNPHDLQHLHYPEFFAPEEIERREIVYPAACRAANAVVVASEFVKRDLMEKYGTPADKIQVVRWSPPEAISNEFTNEAARAVFAKYACPPAPFALYPAMTWEHKNHVRLLEAVALLRERENLKISVVCTGHRNSFYPQIEKRLRELKLENQIVFTGVVSNDELNIFYRRAQFIVVPTLFEAASAPLFEAWQRGAPVACSAVTSLPEQAAGAALLFNPFSVEEIADALKRMRLDDALRASLAARGVERLRDFDLERTLKTYRAVYRKVAGRFLSQQDRYLLEQSQPRAPL